jgi:hypothetical protein
MFSSLLFHKWLIDIVSIAHLPKKSDIFCESFPRNPQFRSRHPLLGRLRAHHAVLSYHFSGSCMVKALICGKEFFIL